MNDITAGEVLRGAADMIAERGHARGCGTDEQGRVCTLRAMSKTIQLRMRPNTYRREAVSNAWAGAGERLQALIGDQGIAGWSDTTPTEDVILTLKKAAEE